jgi:hypothetical protein
MHLLKQVHLNLGLKQMITTKLSITLKKLLIQNHLIVFKALKISLMILKISNFKPNSSKSIFLYNHTQ